jgi:hypothetical protein
VVARNEANTKQMTEIDALLVVEPNNSVLVDIKNEFLASIEAKEKALRYLVSPSEVPETFSYKFDTITRKTDALQNSHNALHQKTDELSEMTDELSEKTDILHDMINVLHEKLDTIPKQDDCGQDDIMGQISVFQEQLVEVHEQTVTVADKMSDLENKMQRIHCELEDHISDTVTGDLGRKVDSLAAQLTKVDDKFSVVKELDNKTTRLQEACAMQHLLMVNSDGPIHGFAKLRGQVQRLQKSTEMLEVESDGRHGSMLNHIECETRQLDEKLDEKFDELYIYMNELDGKLDDVITLKYKVGDIEKKVDRLAGLESKIVSLEKKVDSLAGIEKKLDSLASFEKKLESFFGLHEKLDRLADLPEKVASLEMCLKQQSTKSKSNLYLFKLTLTNM